MNIKIKDSDREMSLKEAQAAVEAGEMNPSTDISIDGGINWFKAGELIEGEPVISLNVSKTAYIKMPDYSVKAVKFKYYDFTMSGRSVIVKTLDDKDIIVGINNVVLVN